MKVLISGKVESRYNFNCLKYVIVKMKIKY